MHFQVSVAISNTECDRYGEFLEQTRRREFEQDPSWQTVDEQPVYSEQEYLEFERQRQMEIQRLVDQGLVCCIISFALHLSDFASVPALALPLSTR